MKAKKVIILLFLVVAVFCPLYLASLFLPVSFYRFATPVGSNKTGDTILRQANQLLRLRKDAQASRIFSDILQQDPGNVDAKWGSAEILRRKYKFNESKQILQDILRTYPSHSKAKISLAYILFKEGDYKSALKMIDSVIHSDRTEDAGPGELALAFMLLGSINAERCSKGWLLSKINYGLQIKSNFERAKELSPELPEVHLGLGTFYLCSPRLFGGSIQKAIEELETAIELAPDFATPYARLAEAYLKKGNNKKSKTYLQRALELDPENEVGLKLLAQ